MPLAQLKLAKALARDGHQIELIYGAVNEGNKPESIYLKSQHLIVKEYHQCYFH